MGCWGRVVAAVLVALVAPALAAAPRKAEPERVTVQHILIGFKRSVPGKKIERTKEQARALAEELLKRAGSPADEGDFTRLVEQHTDDAAPGIYVLVNHDAPLVPGARNRGEMVERFGDVAFSLAVGEVGLAEYRAGSCPYGWHVIKRLE